VDSIVVEVPAAFKPAAVCFQQLLALAASACDHGQTDAPMPFADLERALALGTGELQRSLQAPILASMARDEPRLWIGDTLHVRVAPVTTTFYGLAGPVPVTRWRYRPVDKPRAATVDPIALRVGAVRKSWLPATAEAMAFLVQQSPQREAEHTAHLLGVLPYSDSSFHRVTQAMGARWAQHRDAIEEVLIARLRIPEETTGLTVSLDRVATPMEEPRKRPCGRPPKGAAKRPVARVWRMSYCATVTLHDANGRSLHTLRYGAMPGCDPDTEVIVALQNDVAALRARRPDLLWRLAVRWRRRDVEPAPWALHRGAAGDGHPRVGGPVAPAPEGRQGDADPVQRGPHGVRTSDVETAPAQSLERCDRTA
jgi:hypothetical protein